MVLLNDFTFLKQDIFMVGFAIAPQSYMKCEIFNEITAYNYK